LHRQAVAPADAGGKLRFRAAYLVAVATMLENFSEGSEQGIKDGSKSV
jgi:hypothetical protein